MSRLQQTRRGKIGYVYSSQVNNNVATVNYTRSPYAVQKAYFEQNMMGAGMRPMEGDGFIDIMKDVISKGKNAGKWIYDHKGQIADAYSGEIGTALRNALPDSDETARPGFAGERHALLKLPNGKTGVGNYIGPGTNLIKRLERGDPPRTEVDKVAQLHDIRYGLATTQGDIRKADNIMINKVNQIQRNRGDAPRNIAQASLMRAKIIGEDLGLLRKDAFSGDLSKNSNMPAKDRTLMMNKLNELAPQGYGLKVPGGSLQMPGGSIMLPGDALKFKLLKQMSRKRTKRQAGAGKVGINRTGQSKSRDLGKNYKLMGEGITLPGGGKGPIQKFVVKKVIPSIMSAVGIPKGTIASNGIAKLISKALDMAKSGNLSQIVSHLTKTILPIITAGKLKHMSGGRYIGAGIGAVLGKHKNMLLENLGKGMLKAFKWYLNKGAVSRGMKPMYGSGINLPGGSFGNFWKGFKKGFTMVFKPGAKILGTVATAMGQPEIGIPLTAVSGLL
jgi:hypothetical protein